MSWFALQLTNLKWHQFGALLAGWEVLEKRRPIDGYACDLRGADLKITVSLVFDAQVMY